MRFHRAFVFAAFFLAACAKKKEEPWYYYSSGAGLPDAVLYVNDNPTNQGRALSLFVVEGVNWIRLKGEAGEGGYEFRVIKTPRLLSSEYKVVIDQESPLPGEVNRIMSFNQGKWWHWAWQDADEIKDFGERDLSEIKAIVREVIDGAKRPVTAWSDLMPKGKSRMWSDDPQQIAQANELSDKALKAVRSYKKLSYRECSLDDLEHLVGKQLVLVKAKEGPIFFVGQDESEKPEAKIGEVVWNYSIGADEMFFAKFNGRWTWLVPIP